MPPNQRPAPDALSRRQGNTSRGGNRTTRPTDPADTTATVLVVEDESVIALDIAATLKGLGYVVCATAPSAEQGLALAGEHFPDVVLMDVHLRGDMDGIDAARRIRELFDIPVIFLTGLSDEATFLRAKQVNPFGFLTKPIDERSLRTALEMALLKHDAERTARTARAEAEAADRAKTAFLANMTHEMRTPANSIIALTDLAEEQVRDYISALDPSPETPGSLTDTLENLRTIRDTTNGLLGRLNDVLDYARIASGRVRASCGPVLVADIVEDLYLQNLEAAHARGLGLSFSIAPDVPVQLLGDGERIRRALAVLLDNAIEFTDRGEVTLDVFVAREEGGNAKSVTLGFAVTDTGPGIPRSELDSLFEPFRQQGEVLTKRSGGLGLGLAIARGLAHLLHGEIAIRTDSKGSTFTLTLPLEREACVPTSPSPLSSKPTPAPAPTPGPDTASAMGTTEGIGPNAGTDETATDTASSSAPSRSTSNRPLVLVAEDSFTDRRTLVGLLERAGVRVRSVADGMQALEAVALDSYDALFLDIRMPLLDGLQATRTIREQTTGPTAADVPIIGVSSFSHHDEIAACQAAGMDLCESKPLSAERVNTLLAALANGTMAELARTTSAPSLQVDTRGTFARFGNDMELFIEVWDAFGQDAPGKVDTLRRHATALTGATTKVATRKALADLADAAHALKGASANVGALTLEQRCDEILADLRADDSSRAIKRVRTLGPLLRATMETVHERLRTHEL